MFLPEVEVGPFQAWVLLVGVVIFVGAWILLQMYRNLPSIKNRELNNELDRLCGFEGSMHNADFRSLVAIVRLAEYKEAYYSNPDKKVRERAGKKHNRLTKVIKALGLYKAGVDEKDALWGLRTYNWYPEDHQISI